MRGFGMGHQSDEFRDLIMTTPPTTTITGSTYRLAGWAAIASGVIGIMAFGLLVAALGPHWSGGAGNLMFRTYDAGVILQSLFMIPVAFGLHALARQRTLGMSRATLAVGVVALSGIVLLVSLIFVNVVWDVLYMIPQGILGVWLVVVNRLMSRVLPRGLTRLGTVAGLGLVLVGTFPLAFAIFVDPVGLHGPIPDDQPFPETTANGIIHIVLLIGTLMGVSTYPIWTILLGRRLLRA